jgi:hypothetical protein
MIIVLIGAHGAGKTTLGHALARRMGIPFHDEIGRRLAADQSWRPTGTTAQDPQQTFDERVFGAELERDDAWPGETARIVETWHPGNLAYAERRSPAVPAQFLDQVRSRCRETTPIVVPLLASRAALARRQSEVGDLGFFVQVAERAAAWAARLGLTMLQPVRTDRATPEDLARCVEQAIRAVGLQRSPVATAEAHHG